MSWEEVKAVLEKLPRDERWARMQELPGEYKQHFLDWMFSPEPPPAHIAEARARELAAALEDEKGD